MSNSIGFPMNWCPFDEHHSPNYFFLAPASRSSKENGRRKTENFDTPRQPRHAWKSHSRSRHSRRSRKKFFLHFLFTDMPAMTCKVCCGFNLFKIMSHASSLKMYSTRKNVYTLKSVWLLCFIFFQDGHEICFVGDEAFRELSQVDPKADDLLNDGLEKDKSNEWFAKRGGKKAS